MKHSTLNLNNLAKTIRMIITDVDGVLTDGGIIYDNSGNELKRFNVKDGQVMKTLREQGIKTAVITGRNSEVVKFRCRELKFDYHYHGVKDKKKVFHELLAEVGLQPHDCAFIGDDLPDLCLFSEVGLAAVPADATAYIKSEAHLILEKKGGEGCFRELADQILAAQGKLEAIIAAHRE